MLLFNDNQRILITGGTGFIGSRLCRLLSEDGHRLTVLTRNRKRGQRILGDRVTLVESLGEINDPTFDVLINLSGESIGEGRWTDKRKQQLFDSRVGVTHDLLRFFQKAKTAPPVVISGSAVGFYGPHGEEPLDENAKPVPSFSHELCATWERAASNFTKLGSRVVYLRTGVVLGRGGGALPEMIKPFKFGLGGPIGSGQQWFSWIHRNDLVRLIFHCIDRDNLNGPVNATAPQPVTNAQFAATVGEVLNKPARLRLPGFVLKLMFGQMAEELILSGQRVVPEKALASGFQYRLPNLDAALRDVLLD